jgi:hypothetical protein
MKCNVGKTDKTIRIIIGAAIIALGVYFQSWWGQSELLYCLPVYLVSVLLTCLLVFQPVKPKSNSQLKTNTLKKQKPTSDKTESVFLFFELESSIEVNKPNQPLYNFTRSKHESIKQKRISC